MSRRRKVSVAPGVWRMAVVCTDKGQHPRTKIGELNWFGGGYEADGEGGATFDPPSALAIGTDGRPQEPVRGENSGRRRQTASFLCVRCGRERWLSPEQILKLGDEYGTRRLPRVDISLLA